MYCKNCGKELHEGAKFCAGCGTAFSSEIGNGSVNESGAAPVEAPPPVAKKKFPKGLVIAACAAVVVVLALILVVGGVFTSPKAKLGAAVLKSIDAYTEAYEKLGLHKPFELVKSQKYSQDMTVTLTDVGSYGYYDLSLLEGLGVRMNTGSNLPGRKADFSVTAFYGAADLVTAQMLLDDNRICIASPQILGEDKFYGVDTTTLGVDLENVGVEGSDYLESISFNLFDLVQVVQESAAMTKETESALKDAQEALIKAIVVEKIGKSAVDVNGTSTECAAYSVLIPQDALEAYLDVAVDAAKGTDTEKLMLDVIMGLGLSEDDAEDIVDNMYLDDSGMDDMKDAAEEVLDLLEDIELTAYVKGGYLMAVEYENKLDGVKVSLGLYLGGGKNYVDNLSLVFEGKEDGDKISMELISSGNHAGADGAFTDETTFEVKDGSYTELEFTSEFSYNPKADGNNLSWTFDMADLLEIEADGRMTVSGSKFALELEELALEVEGTKVGAVELTYQLDDYKTAVSAQKAVMLSTLDEDGMEDLVEEIVGNAEDWTGDLVEILKEELSEEELEELMWLFF